MKAGPTVLVALLSLAGCAGAGIIEQTVKPVILSANDPRQICVVENTSVASRGFLEVYKYALSQRNLTVRMLPDGTAVKACPLTTTYTANWRWDLARYLAFANLKVYRNGNLEGQALYDGLRGALDTNKFIKTEAKIEELTNLLFPG